MKRTEEKQVGNLKEERKEKRPLRKKKQSPLRALSDTEGFTALDAPCFRVPAPTCFSPLQG